MRPTMPTTEEGTAEEGAAEEGVAKEGVTKEGVAKEGVWGKKKLNNQIDAMGAPTTTETDATPKWRTRRRTRSGMTPPEWRPPGRPRLTHAAMH